MIAFLHSINQVIFEMVVGCVFFAARAEYLNITETSFCLNLLQIACVTNIMSQLLGFLFLGLFNDAL